MVPMALALERGSQMQAPLGRAVIGGLVMSTFATLLIVPSIFAIVMGRKVPRSPSIYPDDPESAHYDPLAYAPAGESGRQATRGAGHPVAPVPPSGEGGLEPVVEVRRIVPPISANPQPDEHIQTPGGPVPEPAPDAPADLPPLPGDS
jgi:hypothetical protein